MYAELALPPEKKSKGFIGDTLRFFRGESARKQRRADSRYTAGIGPLFSESEETEPLWSDRDYVRDLYFVFPPKNSVRSPLSERYEAERYNDDRYNDDRYNDDRYNDSRLEP